jgi:hypothetical protein
MSAVASITDPDLPAITGIRTLRPDVVHQAASAAG